MFATKSKVEIINNLNNAYYFLAANGEEGTLLAKDNGSDSNLKEYAEERYPGHKTISYKSYTEALCKRSSLEGELIFTWLGKDAGVINGNSKITCDNYTKYLIFDDHALVNIINPDSKEL